MTVEWAYFSTRVANNSIKTLILSWTQILNNTLQIFTIGYHKIKIESFELQSSCSSKAEYATGAGWSSTTDTFRLYNFDFII